MKRNLDIRLYFLPLIFAMVALLPACKKTNDNAAAPIVTSVRMYNPSPKDSLLSTGNLATDPNLSGGTGKYVVIIGNNLQNATEIDFDGVPATFNTALFAPNSAVVQVPAIMFSTIDTTKLYTLQYKTAGGSTTFAFKLGPGQPTITAISNVFANPGDSVYIYGTNLVLVQGFSYAGTKVSSFKYSADGTSLGFLMPAAAPTTDIILATKVGKVTFKIVATPTITGVSNENAYPDDSVYVYGTYLKNIQSLYIAGTQVTSFVESANGSSVGFVLPTLTQSGVVTVTTSFGTGSTVYNVNIIDNSTSGGFPNGEWISNLENAANWKFYGGGQLVSGNPSSGWPSYYSAFPGDLSTYMYIQTGILSPGEGNSYSNYALLFNSAQWVPTANLGDPVSSWAFKFEVNIPQPWNGGTFIIQTSFGSNEAVWEPWRVSSTKTKAYITKGWMTVTIPLSSFRASDPTLGEGRGAPITAITDLVGPSGNTECTMYIKNFSTSPTATIFNGAFDNLRVVKIK